MKCHLSRGALLIVAAFALLPSRADAALDAGDTTWDGSVPPQGVYFHWYEPSFYAGFAPRTQDPGRVHIELSRGQQVRTTVVLGDAELDAYLDDLLARRAIVQELVDAKVIELSTNQAFERYSERLVQVGVAEAVAARPTLGAEGYRKKSAEILAALEPDRTFRIRMAVQDVAARWHAALLATEVDGADAARLDAANAVLPGRINLTQLSPDLATALGAASALARSGPPDSPAFLEASVAFLERASGGRYRARDGFVEALELSAIYPAGTVTATTTYKGEKLPDFGVTGVWSLLRRTHGRGIMGMVDYLSPNPGYGFIPLLGYQYAGGIAYNAFHNAGVRCELGRTPFLPAAWRKVPGERDPAKPYQNLWIASRAPTSHGCTRLGSGHMSELRQIVSTDDDTLERLPTFRNLPQCYDAFDVDGDGTSEVMGVQYYLAFRSADDHVPVASYAPNKREPFYRWLYGENVALAEVGQTRLKSVPLCRFVGRKAEEVRTVQDVRLYEQTWAPEVIQFFRTKKVAFDSAPGFELNRELRKVGAGHATDRRKLQLP